MVLWAIKTAKTKKNGLGAKILLFASLKDGKSPGIVHNLDDEMLTISKMILPENDASVYGQKMMSDKSHQ